MQTYFSKIIYSLMAVVIIVCGLFSFSAKQEDKELQDINTSEDIGRLLFFDNILSSDRSIHCGSCHIPAFGFADTVAFSRGVGGKLSDRNAPSVMNVAFRDSLFWDGRAKGLEAQVIFPIENPNEMNLPFDSAVSRVARDSKYQYLFKKIYKERPNRKNIVHAIASFEKSLETDATPNDRWLNEQEPSGMTAQMIRGRELFTSNRTKCFDCHFTPDFTSDEFKNIGLFNGQNLNDSGRYHVTKKAADIGKFKIPGLRNVAVTAPYMHNGMFKTLREVINYYDNPSDVVQGAIGTDTIMPGRIGLTESEKQDLEAFLHSLTDDRLKKKEH